MANDQTPTARYLAELAQQIAFKPETVEGSIQWNIKYYKSRAPYRLWDFRIFGFAVVTMSVSLPFVSAMFAEKGVLSKLIEKDTLISIFGFVIAILTALNVFFQWQRSWEGYITSQLQLQAAWWEWEASRAEAIVVSDPEKALYIVVAAAHKLISQASQIISAETGIFFKNLNFPVVKKAGPES